MRTQQDLIDEIFGKMAKQISESHGHRYLSNGEFTAWAAVQNRKDEAAGRERRSFEELEELYWQQHDASQQPQQRPQLRLVWSQG